MKQAPAMRISALNELMRPIFGGETVCNESVMFMEKGDARSLLYPISEILAVTSSDGETTYRAGVDYEVVEGKLRVTESSAIPCATAEFYYNYVSPEPRISVLMDGKQLVWGENILRPYQINVTYTHKTPWQGFAQESRADVYAHFIAKLEAGENVTVMFYGDSITYGATSSWLNDLKPHQYPYALLFTEALADLYGYTVHYEDYSHLPATPGLSGAPRVPKKDYVAGTRGVITYVNTSEGGESVTRAGSDEKMVPFVLDPIKKHGCDLLVVAYGMNDGGAADITAQTADILNKVWAEKPDVAIAVVSTMVPHPGTNWEGQQKNQEEPLLGLAAQMRGEGRDVAVARMTSVSKAVLERKHFSDYSGNNINHPNDFFGRLYAQTLLQTVVGYENMQ